MHLDIGGKKVKSTCLIDLLTRMWTNPRSYSLALMDIKRTLNLPRRRRTHSRLVRAGLRNNWRISRLYGMFWAIWDVNLGKRWYFSSRSSKFLRSQQVLPACLSQKSTVGSDLISWFPYNISKWVRASKKPSTLHGWRFDTLLGGQDLVHHHGLRRWRTRYEHNKTQRQ